MKVLIDFAIVVGVVAYPNIGWLLCWAMDTPIRTGIFKNFFSGPEFAGIDSISVSDGFTIFFFVLIWPIILICLLILWLVQICFWLLRIMFWVLRMIFGGIAKKIVGYED